MNTAKVVTRFAPSPTGFMHIGGVRTAMFAYLFARKMKGEFILRIEDTDKKREVAGSIAHIQESLEWLGLSWDYGPDKPGPWGSCIQSERLPIYRQYAETLIEKGLAYPDPYTPEEIDAFKAAAAAEKRPFLFRHHRPETFAPWTPGVPLRLKVPEIKRYTWTDAVRGELTAGEEMLDDFIIIKADGYPTYNFAHIIDDHEMNVTHIMRGDEFIASTPKFLSLYDALGFSYPVFVTMPPILREDRVKKLGKRDGAKDILEYRTEGYLPEAMANFLALIGWNPGGEAEVFTLTEMEELFTLEKIQRGGGASNEEKLRWLNKQHLDRLSDAEFLTYIEPVFAAHYANNPVVRDRISKLLPRIREHTHIRRELDDSVANGEYNYLFSTPDYETSLLQWKKDQEVKDALPRLERVVDILKTADFSSGEAIKAALWPLTEELGRGEVLWPLRVALTGLAQSPDPFTVAYALGQEETCDRLKIACAKMNR